MSNPMGARRQDKLMAICLFPSINFTPVKYVLPLPYPVWRMLDNSINTAATTKLNQEETYILSKTIQPNCIGDFPGQGGGIKSKTVSDEIKPTGSSDSIKVQGSYLIRKGDSCTLNKANTFGKYTTLGAAMSGLAHLVLGGLSFIPGLGAVAAVADAALYAAEGDMMSAGLALAGAVPFCKWGIAAAKGASALSKGIKAALGGGRMAKAFTAGGAWIKGSRLGRAGPCIFGATVQGALMFGPMLVGAPVHALRGAKVLMGDDDLDYQGSSYLPFDLQRLYNSQNANIGWFGQGWRAQGYEQHLDIHAQQDIINLVDNSGRKVPFTYLMPGQSCYNPFENITLYRLPLSEDEQQLTLPSQPIEADAERGSRIGPKEPLRFILYNGNHKPKPTDTLSPYNDYDGIAQQFSHVKSRNGRGTKATVLPSRQVDRYGHTLQLHYCHDAQSPMAHLPQYITDAGGHCYELSFDLIDGNPRLIALKQIEHIDAAAKVAAIELANYSYSKAGDLTEVRRQGKLLRQFAYTNHIMTWQQLPTGLEGHYDYDQTEDCKTARVINHTLSNGRHYQFDYRQDDQGLNHSLVTEQPGCANQRTHTYTYDSWYIPKAYTDPLGHTTHLTHDHLDRLIRVRDPKGGQTLYHYHGSELGAIRSQIGINAITGQPEYRTTRYQYLGQKLVAINDPLGHTERLSYNDRGEIAAYTDANGNTTTYHYDEHGNLIRQTLANGSHFDFDYDEQGVLIQQSDCSGYQTQYQYDQQQRLTAIIDAKGQQTQYHYDQSRPWYDLIQQIHYPDGSHIKLAHDDSGRLTSYTDAKDQQTQYQYDIDNLPTKRIDALGHSLSYQYDSLRRLSTLTNENGEDWTFDYDKGDHLISETRFDNHQSRYDYDPLGDLITQIDNPNQARHQQRHVRYQRDLIGQLITKHSVHYPQQLEPLGSQAPKFSKRAKPDYQRTRYQYNLAGQLVSAANHHSRTDLGYDAAGQLIREATTAHLNLQGQYQRQQQTLTHQYDDIGNRIKTVLPDGKVLNQLYYGSGHLYNQSLQDGEHTTEIRHSERNQLHQETVRHQGTLTSAFDYDPMGRLTKQFSSSSDHIAIERHYNYDALGQLTHLTGKTRLSGTKRSANPAQHFSRNHQYQYDKIGRLTQHRLTDYANHTGITEVFAFDPASNRIPVNPAQDSSDNTTVSQPQGRPTSLTTHDKYLTYTYDSHGRVLYKTESPLGQDGKPLKQSGNGIVGYRKSLQLGYNADHELAKSVSIVQQGFTITIISTDYYYDAFGRRIFKHSESKQQNRLHSAGNLLVVPRQPQKTQQTRIRYLWDGNRQLQEQTDTHVFTTVYEQDSFEPVARLVWLKDELSESANDDSYTDDKPTNGVQVFHYHNDHLGTPNELTNQDGEVIWLADYEAWGNTAKVIWREEKLESLQVSADELQPIRFQGQSFDAETGFHYNRFRYFDPDLGMFTTRDPIGLFGGNNVFQYAPNPVGWIDPFGLARSESRILSRNMSNAGRSVPKNYAAHHKVATNVVRDNPLTQEAVKRGIYDANRASNGIALPMKSAESLSSGKPLHSGGHLKSYFNHVHNLLNTQTKKLVKSFGSLANVPDNALLSKIGAVERLIHTHLENDKIRLQATDPRPHGTKSKC